LGNHESNGIEDISINYTSFGEVYDRSTTIVNSNFSTIIAESVLADLDLKTIAKCKKCLEWNKWKEAIEAELSSLKKKGVHLCDTYTSQNISCWIQIGIRSKEE
jgi:hypothetical protein